jgi:hypothetical protein
VPQLLELQRVSSRLQGILLDYHAAFDLDILDPCQFAKGVIAATPYFLNPMMIGGCLGAQTVTGLAFGETQILMLRDTVGFCLMLHHNRRCDRTRQVRERPVWQQVRPGRLDVGTS